ncbi:MAG: GAF domain-containing protein, partial [candidate division Zixibacteria bacterium]|nr:GAF domain-containing protein [candidate division Zixibacteria bacterium]
MPQQILVVHSQPSVIDDVLEAVRPFAPKTAISTDPSLLETLCRHYRPDLSVVGYEPERCGGSDVLRKMIGVSGTQTLLLLPPSVSSLPSGYLHAGVVGAHPFPIVVEILRARIERCLWLVQPVSAVETLKQDIGERARSLDTFLGISHAITQNLRKDLDTLLRHIAEESSKMLDADRTSLFIYDRANNVLWSRVAEGEGGRTITVGMDQPGIVVHVARTGQPLRVEDAYREPLFNRDVDRITGYRTRTILCLPVRNYHGELIGVIETMNKKTGYFDDADERILSIASFLFAAAIENAQLY